MERIVITFNADGSFRGASVTDFDGLPKPLDEAGLTTLFPTINASALAVSNKVDELEAYKSEMVEKVSTALQSGDMAKIQSLAVDFLKPEEEKKRAEKVAKFEALKSELGL